MAKSLSLARRVLEPEDVDDPALATDQLHGALGGLSTINILSASAGMLWSPIRQLARELRVDRLRVLDVATGAGDVPLALWRKSQRSGLTLDIHGVDISDRCLEFARQKAAAAAAPLEFQRLDVATEELPRGFDVVMCSLFLHHLSDESAAGLLRAMAATAGRMVLVNDLRRGWGGLMLALFAGRCLTCSSVVRRDSVRSVRAAFTIAEARNLAESVGLSGTRVQRRWPCRYLLSWCKTHVKQA